MIRANDVGSTFLRDIGLQIDNMVSIPETEAPWEIHENSKL